MAEIDEDLHGRENMRWLSASNVLISGLNGLGAEIAKNLALENVKSVTLHDVENVEIWDLAANFFLCEDDIGKNKAVACVEKLQELNNAVLLSVLTEELTNKQLSKFQAVIFTNESLGKAIEFNNYCRSHQPPISFIKAEVCGLFGSVFCDFGPEFTVLDFDGEDPQSGIIASISNDNPAMVSCVDHKGFDFQDGDLVIFSEVQGMTELNDGKPRSIVNSRPYSFCIDEDTSNFGTYAKGGTVTEVKEPLVVQFSSLKDTMKEPGKFLSNDFSKYEGPPLLHFAFLALDKFKEEFGRFPDPNCEQDAHKFVNYAASINEAMIDYKTGELDEKLLRIFASGSRAILSPMVSIFGGIVGQEVLKACSGKLFPDYQLFYFDSSELLPTYPLNPKDLKLLNSRYDAQISVFGSHIQKKLGEAKIFVCGPGPLGNEFLKNLTLMGVSCSSKGQLTIRDDGIIEKNNWSQQSLFRNWNIGKFSVASTAANAIKSSMHIALENHDLDVIFNASSSVYVRMYMHMRCLYFQKPLFESRILAAKGVTRMVIPHRSTKNYGASRGPPEKQALMYMVHSFPCNIDNCLAWARSEFEDLLDTTPNEVNYFMLCPAIYAAAMRKAGDAQAKGLLKRVCECLDNERCDRFEDCITWARLKFEDYFSNRVKQLIFTYENAAPTTDTPFWSAPKCFPQPLEFSAADSSHIHFILSASILRAVSFGIPIPDWAKNMGNLVDAVNKVTVPEFELKNGAKVETDEKATNISSASVDNAVVVEDLLIKLQACAKKLPPGFQMKPIQFEEDDDTNFHVDLIAGLANMLARNYRIQEVDKLKAKFIIKRIIPASATSISIVTGVACLELYKGIAGAHLDEDHLCPNLRIVTEPTQLPKDFLQPSAAHKMVVGLSVGLCQHGGICTVQIAMPHGLYLVDIIGGGQAVMRACKPALESEYITKVIHGCKTYSELFCIQYGICLHNVMDVQIGYSLMEEQERISEENGISYSEKSLLSALLNQIPNIWKIRPLSPMLMEAANSDLCSLLKVYDIMMEKLTKQSIWSLAVCSKQQCRTQPPVKDAERFSTQGVNEFLYDNPPTEWYITYSGKKILIATPEGTAFLGGFFRKVINKLRKGKSYEGLFQLHHLIIRNGNNRRKYKIQMKATANANPKNCLLDLGCLLNILGDHFCDGNTHVDCLGSLKWLIAETTSQSLESAETRERFLCAILYHMLFASPMDKSSMIIHLQRLFNFLGTDDQIQFITVVNNTPYQDISLKANEWRSAVRREPLLATVYYYTKPTMLESNPFSEENIGCLSLGRHFTEHSTESTFVDTSKERADSKLTHEEIWAQSKNVYEVSNLFFGTVRRTKDSSSTTSAPSSTLVAGAARPPATLEAKSPGLRARRRMRKKAKKDAEKASALINAASSGMVTVANVGPVFPASSSTTAPSPSVLVAEPSSSHTTSAPSGTLVAGAAGPPATLVGKPPGPHERRKKGGKAKKDAEEASTLINAASSGMVTVANVGPASPASSSTTAPSPSVLVAEPSSSNTIAAATSTAAAPHDIVTADNGAAAPPVTVTAEPPNLGTSRVTEDLEQQMRSLNEVHHILGHFLGDIIASIQTAVFINFDPLDSQSDVMVEFWKWWTKGEYTRTKKSDACPTGLKVTA